MLLSFERDYSSFFKRPRYIAMSEAKSFYVGFKPYLSMLWNNLVKQYIANSAVSLGFSADQCNRVLAHMEGFFEKVKVFNDTFVENQLLTEKGYLDSILNAVDPAVSLDEEQRRAVITDEDYCLLVAGAGAGKTTTMAAKVKYLVDKLRVPPEDIIVISYTSKAIDELRERINRRLKIRQHDRG